MKGALIRGKIARSSRSNTITTIHAIMKRTYGDVRFARVIENFRLGIIKNRKR